MSAASRELSPLGPNVILSTYFTGKPDPQLRSKRKRNVIKHLKTYLRSRRGGASAEIMGSVGPDEFERIEVWYRSLIKVGCQGVIFHDCLSDGFIQKWTVPQVRFEAYKLKTPRSVNDERYQCYLEWLDRHPEVERVFLVDLFDIEFFRDPFALMAGDKYDVYSGGDPGEYNDNLVRKKMQRAFGKAYYESEIKLNAGTCGAPRETMIRLLKAIVSVHDDLTARGVLDNLNMGVYNKCMYDLFPKERIMYGYPLNSRFKKYEREGNFAIRHK